MIDLFGKKRKQREKDLEIKVEALVSVLNDLLWNLDTLPMTASFKENWDLLKSLDKKEWICPATQKTNDRR